MTCTTSRGIVVKGGFVKMENGMTIRTHPGQGFIIGDKVWVYYDYVNKRVRTIKKRNEVNDELFENRVERGGEGPPLEELGEFPFSTTTIEREEEEQEPLYPTE